MRLKANLFLMLSTAIVLLQFSEALPVSKNKKEEKEEAPVTPATPDVETALEYERYLKEVVEALESDPDFRKKLDKAPEADIRVRTFTNLSIYKAIKLLIYIYVGWKNCTRIGICESSCTLQIRRNQAA